MARREREKKKELEIASSALRYGLWPEEHQALRAEDQEGQDGGLEWAGRGPLHVALQNFYENSKLQESSKRYVFLSVIFFCLSVLVLSLTDHFAVTRA